MEKQSCSFCGVSGSDEVLVSGVAGVHICKACIEYASDFFEGTTEEPLPKNKEVSIFTPSQIYNYLNTQVVSQDVAKKALSLAFYQHLRRVEELKSGSSVVDQKSNVLMLGPTGSGKTLIIKNAAKKMNVPFVSVDATSLTEAGYIGDSVSSIIEKLALRADYDLEAIQQGVVFIDEIDKISSKVSSGTKDVGGSGVQESLLKMIEGDVVEIKSPLDDKLLVDTTNILFIAAGAFSGIEKFVSMRENDNAGIGFSASFSDEEKVFAYSGVKTEDLISYGMMPEFVGRFPVLTSLTELLVDDLIKVMVEPEFSLVNQYRSIFERDGGYLDFDQDALSAIAKKALDSKSGARGLRTIIEALLTDVMFSLPEQKSFMKYTVTLDFVNGEDDILSEEITEEDFSNYIDAVSQPSPPDVHENVRKKSMGVISN